MPAKRVIDDYAQVQVTTRAQWRRWLGANHAKAPGIWLVRFKKGFGPAPSYDEIVEEALCVGWVDSLPRALDEERTMLLITPRKAKSVWSASNRERVARLLRDGLMRPAGIASVETAKANGSWDALLAAESLELPPALVQAFRGRKVAKANWDAFTEASRRAILQWLLSAKTDATREKRVAEIVAKAAVGKRANFPVDNR
ncbi:MAG: YdeI/OmpD-associated family protein [Gemmatimonadaceae bacterium]|jgi:uncharacterized protein YdeI (YjbR/CyaY-like superfamily)|nr:YdeI/OmpD-associated family protein [Gemmatimonadaceae bacterium]